MITSTRRVSPDKSEVRIAFSLQQDSDVLESTPSFPDLEQRLQPVSPCSSLRESVQLYRDHCRMAKEFHQVKQQISLLQDHKRKLLAELVEEECVAKEMSCREEEFRVLSEENAALLNVHTERALQLETLSSTNEINPSSSAS
ncbi:hypothetical protein DPEC_G00230590 [Dallia pectoralis]|uniref:Uncharacterized protein n=1 Tax=Dallia pectoralis TaxID=75939 RepID=A0ACC2G219_DALPE|nr:hypothetical protein DPEC_G00230590 [Dallia pectoralis]